MMVHVVHVLIGETTQLAGVFEDLKVAHGYLSSNGLIGTVQSMELIKKETRNDG